MNQEDYIPNFIESPTTTNSLKSPYSSSSFLPQSPIHSSFYYTPTVYSYPPPEPQRRSQNAQLEYYTQLVKASTLEARKVHTTTPTMFRLEDTLDGDPVNLKDKSESALFQRYLIISFLF